MNKYISLTHTWRGGVSFLDFWKGAGTQQIIKHDSRDLKNGKVWVIHSKSHCCMIHNKMNPETLLCLFYQTCLHPLCRRFPPSFRFRKSFLTELIRRVSEWSERLSVHLMMLRVLWTLDVVVNTAAGSRRLWTPGRAVWRSSRGCWSWRHLRVLQELPSGRGTLVVLREGSQLQTLMPWSWYLSFPAAQRGSREPAGERGSDLRWNHRPGDLGGGSLPGRVGIRSAGDLQWQVRATQGGHCADQHPCGSNVSSSCSSVC